MRGAIQISRWLHVEPKIRGVFWAALGVGVLLLGLLIGGIVLWNRLNAVLRTPVSLADAVVSFNANSANNRVGMHEPPLTVEEVISVINSKLPTLTDANERVKGIYQQIVATGQLPEGGELTAKSAYGENVEPSKDVWWINLEVPTGPHSGYGLRIRNTDTPAVTRDRSTRHQ
jgi:hypothetical protein